MKSCKPNATSRDLTPTENAINIHARNAEITFGFNRHLLVVGITLVATTEMHAANTKPIILLLMLIVASKRQNTETM